MSLKYCLVGSFHGADTIGLDWGATICICKPFYILPIWGDKENGCSVSITAVLESKALKQIVFSRTEGLASVLRTKIASYIVTS